MQKHTQIPGQAPGQAGRGQQQNGNATNTSGLQSTWQCWEQDTGLRRHIVENILQLFRNRKPHVAPEWQRKLPDFAKKLEEALYKDAASKEEYADLKTLEQRLQTVARRMVPKQQPHSMASSAPLGNMIATPGAASNMMPTPGNGSSMMPTPGGVSAMMPTPGSTGNLMQSGVGGGGLSNMIPTPGNGNNLMSNWMMLGNGQHLMNGAANLHTPPAYLMPQAAVAEGGDDDAELEALRARLANILF